MSTVPWTTTGVAANACCCCPDDTVLGSTATVVITGNLACTGLCWEYQSGSSVKPQGSVNGTYTLTWNLGPNQWQLLNHNVPGATVKDYSNAICTDPPSSEPSLNLDFELFCSNGIFTLTVLLKSIPLATQAWFAGSLAFSNPMTITNSILIGDCGGQTPNGNFGYGGSAAISWP